MSCGPRVAVVSSHSDQLRALATAIHARLATEDALKVGYYTPEEFFEELRRLAAIATAGRQSRSTQRRSNRDSDLRRSNSAPPQDRHEDGM